VESEFGIFSWIRSQKFVRKPDQEFYSNDFVGFTASHKELEFNIFVKTGARVKLFGVGVESKNSDFDHLCFQLNKLHKPTSNFTEKHSLLTSPV